MSDHYATFSAALSGAAAPPPSAPAESTPAPVAAPVAASEAPAPSAAPITPAPAAPVASPPPSATPAADGAAPVDAPAAETALETEEEFRFPDEIAAKDAPAQPEAAKDDEEDHFGGKIPSDVERAAVTKYLKSEKGRLGLQQFKVARELQKAPHEGGLGFIPDATQTREAFQHSANLRTMAQQFHSGDPAAAQNWVAQWFLPQNGGPASRGATAVAGALLSTLAEQARAGNQGATELYRQAATPAVNNFVDELYDYASSMPDAESRAIWANVAHFVEAYRTGGKSRLDEKTGQEFIQTGKFPSQPNAPDPQRQQIDKDLRAINAFKQEQAQRAEFGMAKALHDATDSPLRADINVALAPLKEHYSDRAFAAIAKDFHAEVVRATKANPANLRAAEAARNLARRNPTPDNIQKAGKAWAEAARSSVRSLRAQYLKDNLGPKVQESAERHKTLEAASQKRSAPSVAAPVGKDLAVGTFTPQRLPDGTLESRDEARRRVFSGVMTAAS